MAPPGTVQELIQTIQCMVGHNYRPEALTAEGMVVAVQQFPPPPALWSMPS